jgi:hypothetical protein
MFGKLITVEREREREREREQGEPLREVAKEMPVVRFVRILTHEFVYFVDIQYCSRKRKKNEAGKAGKASKGNRTGTH